MDYTHFTLALPSSPLTFSPTSLYALLLTLPDHRHKRGVHYPLVPMLLIALFAKLLGCNSRSTLARFAKLTLPNSSPCLTYPAPVCLMPPLGHACWPWRLTAQRG